MKVPRLGSFLVFCLAVACIAVPARAAGPYVIEEMPTLGGTDSAGLGVNDLGDVAGYAFLSNGEFRAVLWSDGTLTDLGTLGGPFSIAYDVNDAGRIVGQSEKGGFPQTRFAFYLDPGDKSQTALANLPDTYNAIARTVDGSGHIAGASLTVDEADAVIWNDTGAILTLPAFLEEPGAQGDVWDSNDAGDLVGWSQYIDPINGFIGRRAALWPGGDPDGTIVDLGTLGGNGSEARGINNHGQIVGIAGIPTGGGHATLWSGGGVIDLGDLAGPGSSVSSWALGINDSGQVVGTSQNAPGSAFRAFVWGAGTMQDLNDLIPPGSGWVLTRAEKINGIGQIVGVGTAPSGEQRGFLLTPVGAPVCGDGVCGADESCEVCGPDCTIPASTVCGNGVCETAGGEDCLSCPADCAGRQGGNPAQRYCCGDGDGQNPVGCGDPRCTSGGLTCSDLAVAGTCCGDGICQANEDSSSCSNDCGVGPTCGDGTCDPGETSCSCAVDCGAPPAVELNCSNGVDDDCDLAVDCDDSDCAGLPECACLPKNAACTADGECCSGDCKANGRCR